MNNPYDQRYDQQEYYWGVHPSLVCLEVLKKFPPDKPFKLLDIGCAAKVEMQFFFFARNGYHVSAFDSSEKGVQKAKELAEKASVRLRIYSGWGDIKEFRIS